MPYQDILLEKKEQVLIVTLNRPQKKNAISPRMVEELESVFHSVGHHGHGTRAMILQGGPGLFCAGLDLDLVGELSDQQAAHFIGDIEKVFLALLNAPFPIIAAVDGPAVAGGFDLAVMCDIRLASPRALFGQPEINLGVTQLIDPLWKIVGLGRARELVMTGRLYDAEEAHQMGLVNQVVPQEALFDRALELAQELAHKDPQAMRATKEVARIVPGLETNQALRTQMWILRSFFHEPQKRKRMQSYLRERSSRA